MAQDTYGLLKFTVNVITSTGPDVADVTKILSNMTRLVTEKHGVQSGYGVLGTLETEDCSYTTYDLWYFDKNGAKVDMKFTVKLDTTLIKLEDMIDQDTLKEYHNNIWNNSANKE